jgi:hypothetical protein
MAVADLGTGEEFILKLLNTKVNRYITDNIHITDEKYRYKLITNFLLQTILIIGHLQSSGIEFFHGDYKPDNVFVMKKDMITKSSYHTFKVFNTEIRVKNMGFSVLIADFDSSSITIKNNTNYISKPNSKSKSKSKPKNYRIIPPVKYSLLLSNYVSSIIKNYGDLNPDSNIYNPSTKSTKRKDNNISSQGFFINNIIPRQMNLTMSILRAAGVNLYRDIDLYTFFIKLLDNKIIRDYILSNKLDTTLLKFMSDSFRKTYFEKPANKITISESAYITIKILNEIKEPMYKIFNKKYINELQKLNLSLH